MECRNHAGLAAVARCAGCAEAFCPDCLIDIAGQYFCGSCKTMAVQNQPLQYEAATIPCKEADDALKYAIIGIFCFGIILEPMALSKASQASKKMKLNPRLSGSGKVTAAYIIASLGLILWVVGLIVRFSNATNGTRF